MKFRLLLFLSFSLTTLLAQYSDNPENLRAKTFELSVKTIPPQILKLPFQFIKIIDSRFDTSKLGFRASRKFLAGNYVFEKILLREGVRKGIENFYNDYYKSNFTANGKTLLISVKKLWINNLPDRQARLQNKNIDRESLQDIHAKFEYYFGTENSYVPIKRIDTIFQLTPNMKVEDFEPKDENKLPFFCFALEKMIENIKYDFYVKSLDQKKPMSIDDIGKYNAKTKNIPVLNQEIKKGVFLTFDEFKNNQPSIPSFNKRKISNRKIYEVTDEKGNVLTHYFAYCDGEKLAIAKRLSDLIPNNTSQDNYGIYKVGYGFEFFENHFQKTDRQSNVSVGNDNIPFNTQGIFSMRVPRQIDLETGDIY